MMVFALACWGASLFIPRTGEGAPNLVIDRNIFASTGALLKHLRGDPRLWWGALVTSWFWLVGAVVLSLLPPLVKIALGGTEEVVTAFLAIFSIAIAVGSGLAAWLAAGRIVLLPTLIGAVLLGLFALDLGWTTMRLAAGTTAHGRRGRVRTAARHSHRDRSRRSRDRRRPLHRADLRGRAGLGRRRPARPRGRRRQRAQRRLHGRRRSLSRCCRQFGRQHAGAVHRCIGVANLVVAVVIGRTMPASALQDFLSIIFRAFFRIEVKGLENLAKAGPNAIIALNHVSFLDAALALSLLQTRAGVRDRHRDREALVGASRS